MKSVASSYVVAVLFLPLLGFTFLDPVAKKNLEGNRLFDEGRFEAALEHYREAQLEDAESKQLHFNAGDALYKQGRHDEAIQEFEHALDDPDASFSSKSLYNLGNVLFRKNQLQEAVGAYKKALELDPNDTAAKINLEYVRDLLDQQEEEQRQEQDKQEKDKEEGEEEESSPEDKEQGADGQQKPEDTQDDNQETQQPNEEGRDETREDEATPKEGELSLEEAERLLEALKAQEIEAQKRRRIRLSEERYTGNEW